MLLLGVAGLALGAVAYGVPGMGRPFNSLFAASATNIPLWEVKRANLPITISDKGSLESSDNKDAFCEVEGQAQIIKIMPEGTRVKAGELVVELDSSSLRDQLSTQKINTQQAESSHRQATLTREVAETAVIEYKEGTFKQDRDTAKGEIALAKSELTRAEDRLQWSDRMVDVGYVSKAQNTADRLSLEKAKFTLEQSMTKLDVLQKYTQKKTIKELEADVEKAKTDEKAKEATLDLEQGKERKLIRQISKCKILAPGDGLIVYANDPNRFGGNNQPQIEEGATVRERQKLFSLPDVTKMRVNTKVHESMVDRISPGLRALVRVDAFPGDELKGRVASVAPLPDPNSFFSSDIKVYTTQIQIENGPPGIRPGMTAQVQILITELVDVLSIPVTGVLPFKGSNYAYVRLPNQRGFDRREITLGLTNDKLIEIKTGLKPGDLIVLNPSTLLSEDEKREATSANNKSGTKKDWGGAGKGAPGVGVPGAPGGPDAKGQGGEPKAKGKGKGARKGGGGMAAFSQKYQNISADDRAKMKEASPEDRKAIMLKAGFTEEEIQQMDQMRRDGGVPGGGGGPGGGPGGGGPGGGGGSGGSS
jgi:HlyD family secretion protein